MELFIVLSTFPDTESARRAANALIAESLAACVNLLPGVESIYRWKGKLETSQEILALIKTTAECYPDLEARLRELHPYEVPEIIALRGAAIAKSYRNWLGQCIRSRSAGNLTD